MCLCIVCNKHSYNPRTTEQSFNKPNIKAKFKKYKLEKYKEVVGGGGGRVR